jgi:hypothetical protein
VLSAAFVGAVEVNILGLPPLPFASSGAVISESEDETFDYMSALGSRIDDVIEHLKKAVD